ncbi:MAG: hypothetical protein M0P70_05805 [Desulfobulbaceae bacterium]|nr:hypothetical protein [Desulfobulbaceae bacterium]
MLFPSADASLPHGLTADTICLIHCASSRPAPTGTIATDPGKSKGYIRARANPQGPGRRG